MKWFMLIAGLVVMTLGAWLLMIAPTTYSGKAVFRTEEEYIAFKEVLANPNVTISEMSALSSAPPIIVEYRVSAKKGYDFPYRQQSDAIWNTIVGVTLLVAGVASFVGAAFMRDW